MALLPVIPKAIVLLNYNDCIDVSFVHVLPSISELSHQITLLINKYGETFRTTFFATFTIVGHKRSKGPSRTVFQLSLQE